MDIATLYDRVCVLEQTIHAALSQRDAAVATANARLTEASAEITRLKLCGARQAALLLEACDALDACERCSATHATADRIRAALALEDR